MNIFSSYLLNLALTLAITILLTMLLRAALWRILIDLCGTEDRAHFWTRFAMIMLIALPLVTGLGYTPEAGTARDLFFETTRQLRGNLLSYLFALAVVGGFISLFSLFAPRSNPRSS